MAALTTDQVTITVPLHPGDWADDISSDVLLRASEAASVLLDLPPQHRLDVELTGQRMAYLLPGDDLLNVVFDAQHVVFGHLGRLVPAADLTDDQIAALGLPTHLSLDFSPVPSTILKAA